VAAGQATSDLDYASTTALTLNGGTIEDATGNEATLTMPSTGTDALAALTSRPATKPRFRLTGRQSPAPQ